MRRPRSLRGLIGGAAAPAPILPDLRLAICAIIYHCILCPLQWARCSTPPCLFTSRAILSSSLEAIVKAALEKFGDVHILVANAGILRDKSFQAMTELEWDIVLAILLRSVFICDELNHMEMVDALKVSIYAAQSWLRQLDFR
ncbi:hypothetical protein FB451DRAFT_1455584 [Mycena latifolia]|nr:hypothetical protein FB451DRAFT_1455584 [Mycena latifolia]